MTTLAYDGTTLAADQCSWSGGCRRRVRKVFKITGTDGRRLLVAFTGDASYCLRVKDWMEGKGERPNPRDFVPVDQVMHQCALAVDQEGRIWTLGNDLHWQPVREKVFAMGAGQEYAWGALEAGASAKRAVQIAIKRSDFAGFGVDTVKF